MKLKNIDKLTENNYLHYNSIKGYNLIIYILYFNPILLKNITSGGVVVFRSDIFFIALIF